MPTKSQVKAPCLFTWAPSWCGSTNLSFPPHYIQIRELGINIFIPESLSKRSLWHDSGTLYLSPDLTWVGSHWLTARTSLHSVVQLILCALFRSQLSCSSFCSFCFHIFLIIQNSIYLTPVLDPLKVAAFLPVRGVLKTCQKNPDNNITMCDIISETVSLLLVLCVFWDWWSWFGSWLKLTLTSLSSFLLVDSMYTLSPSCSHTFTSDVVIRINIVLI